MNAICKTFNLFFVLLRVLLALLFTSFQLHIVSCRIGFSRAIFPVYWIIFPRIAHNLCITCMRTYEYYTYVYGRQRYIDDVHIHTDICMLCIWASIHICTYEEPQSNNTNQNESRNPTNDIHTIRIHAQFYSLHFGLDETKHKQKANCSRLLDLWMR